MEAYHISGGRPLRGSIAIHGAKNGVLPILAATLAVGGRCTLTNCPEIRDVDTALQILRHLGCKAERSGDVIETDAAGANRYDIPASLMRKMRAAVIFLGALLTRFGQAVISLPGGCVLGARPIDLHLSGLERMGARVEQEDGRIACTLKDPLPCTITLAFPSVGATENLLLAALRCKGEIILCNTAREPEIADLIGFLRACGAEIRENGSILRVQGGRPLSGCTYRILPDRMEAATYLAAAAATRGELTLTDVCPEHLTAVTAMLRRAGCEISETKCTLHLRCEKLLAVGPIRTAPYDGFPTDAQAPMMAAMTVAEGVSVFEENIFEDRLRHVSALRRLGAQITATHAHAVVTGVDRLHGAQMEATDLRGGAAMVIGALCAEGESVLTEIGHIERGYADFVPLLQSCGAEIERRS